MHFVCNYYSVYVRILLHQYNTYVYIENFKLHTKLYYVILHLNLSFFRSMGINQTITNVQLLVSIYFSKYLLTYNLQMQGAMYFQKIITCIYIMTVLYIIQTLDSLRYFYCLHLWGRKYNQKYCFHILSTHKIF